MNISPDHCRHVIIPPLLTVIFENLKNTLHKTNAPTNATPQIQILLRNLSLDSDLVEEDQWIHDKDNINVIIYIVMLELKSKTFSLTTLKSAYQVTCYLLNDFEKRPEQEMNVLNNIFNLYNLVLFTANFNQLITCKRIIPFYFYILFCIELISLFNSNC